MDFNLRGFCTRNQTVSSTGFPPNLNITCHTILDVVQNTSGTQLIIANGTRNIHVLPKIYLLYVLAGINLKGNSYLLVYSSKQSLHVHLYLVDSVHARIP